MSTARVGHRRILILSFYYPPDLSACSFRMSAFVPAVQRLIDEGDRIDVLTTLPNRYNSFRSEAAEVEIDGAVQVRRFGLPSHRSGMMDQSRAFLAYARAVLRAVRGQQYDLVFATSSRLMTAFLGSIVARRTGARLYLDLRDIFTETMEDVLRGRLLRHVLPPFYWIERYTLRCADRVNLVSPGFVEYFTGVVPDHDYRVFANGIDRLFVDHDFAAERPAENTDTRLIVYAGNMGEGQGLHRVIPAVAAALGAGFRFRLIGEGGRRAELEQAVTGLDNVEILDPMGREELLTHYAAADALFLHLNDYPAFRRVLPSKLFEYAATGKPLLAGVAGVSRRFLEEEVPGVKAFNPCDTDAMIEACRYLPIGPVDRQEFIRRHRRDRIIDEMARDMLGLC